jgi:hypothetical protein
MNFENHVYSGNNRLLHPILASWTSTVEAYVKRLGHNDAPWWYNERATIGSLAAAAWAAKAVALEEYSTQKGKDASSYSGRCDLRIHARSGSLACEVKQAWCGVGRRAKNGHITVKEALRRACADARSLTKNEGRRFGVCFAVPHLPPRDEDHIDTQLKIWLQQLSEIDYCSIAWVFPAKSRKLQNWRGYYYPGVAVLFKEVFRQA